MTATPVIPSLPSTTPSTTPTAAVDEAAVPSGSGPQPQSYVASSVVQSNCGFSRRVLIWLWRWQSQSEAALREEV
jgi:hypothetical protein